MKKASLNLKKVFFASWAVLTAQVAHAGDLYCGANTEKVPASGVYDKSAFWEKVDPSKHSMHFLLADGSVVKMEETTPEIVQKIEDGALGFSIYFAEGKTYLFIGKVKINRENGKHEIQFTDTVMAGAADGSSPLVMGNGAIFMCKDL